MYQKRLKKERRARRRLAEQLDLESKRRCHFEEALKSTSADTFRAITGEIFVLLCFALIFQSLFCWHLSEAK